MVQQYNLSILFIIALLTMSLYGQKSDFKAEISNTVIASTQDKIPFWLRANTGFEFSEVTNVSGVFDGMYAYDFGNLKIEAGAYFFARDGLETAIQRRDLYAQATHKWFRVIAGAKKREEAFWGLSITNKNYLYSNNARPLPGLINEPFTIGKFFNSDLGIAHYQRNDERFVVNMRVHYKRLNVSSQISTKCKLTCGLQHFVQWAGTSPVSGKLKNNLGGYWNVFIANKTTELGLEGELENAVGNYLGSYLFRYDLVRSKGEIFFYHEHPFEVGSGTAFKNLPDGVWGFTFKPLSNKIINRVLYEYVDSRSQSASANNNRTDSYVSNSIYRSGWTFEENIIGNPFFKIT
jgi:hypothetical protein